ncbi:hypothetical protein MMC09_000358 [Bachmanniomyces sp. S44760]|nr:hypothetical protein [Bachmanniomyces sp. S44760]
MPATYIYRQPTEAVPLAMPHKTQYYTQPTQSSPYSGRMAVSPPEAGSSVNTSAVPSLTSGSYVGSNPADYESSHAGAASVDMVDMMHVRLSSAINPLPLDRSLVRQAQTSGQLNAKNRELAELQALAQRRLKSTRANFTDGMNAAKEVKRDLEWTQKRVTDLKTKANRRYPTSYHRANAKYPIPVDS